MKITFDSIELARGNAHCEEVKDLNIKGSKEIQVSTPLRSQEVKIFDRGNLKTLVTFTNTRKHKDKDAASLFALKHAAVLSKRSGKVLFALENENNTILCLNNASIKNIKSTCCGILSTHWYEILGSKFETIKQEK